ncbi:MAG: hypothetical protein DRO65_03020 [Candidatus Altiarchaeales archaeon]|nr:MAG: hypothetical protein DRO65_03020 [Candidatus Altiarchaeales archaeon]
MGDLMGERRLFGANGIRGVANERFTPEFCARIGLAIGTYFGGGNIAIGGGVRLSSQMISNAVVSDLLVSRLCEGFRD